MTMLSALGISVANRAMAQSQDQVAVAKEPSAPLPFEIVTVDGARALEEWTHLKGAGRGWPVVVGSDEDLKDLTDGYAENPGKTTVAEILAQASTIVLPKDLKAWQSESGYGDTSEVDEPIDDLPVVPPYDEGLSISIDILTGKPFPTVHIVLLPTDKSWEAPAYLKWGGWNECPPPAHHVAILKSWHDQFGTEVAGMNADTMNLSVDRPIQNKNDAIKVARDQYVYCPDIVDQGTNSVAALAATLLNQRWWFFWWD